MPITNRGRRGIFLEDQNLRGRGAASFEPQNTVTIFDDFLIDVLADDPLVTVTQSGTPLTAGVVSSTGGGTPANAGGWISGKTDDVDVEIDEISIGGLGTGAGTPYLAPSRAGKGMLVCEWGFVIPTALTARQYFVGLSDDPVEGTATNGSINITGTYALVTVATDAAGFVFSSLATAPTLWKYAAVKNDVDSPMSAGNDTITGVVDCFTTLRVELDASGNAAFYASIAAATTAGRVEPAFVGSFSGAVTAATPLLPMFTAAPTTTTGVEWEIDYVYASVAR